MKLVVTDLDGTLLNDTDIVSEKDVNTLYRLSTQGILRVIATGRSMFSLQKVLSPNFPVDYVIFSSGAGIVDWHSGALIHENILEASKVVELVEVLKQLDVDFMVHHPIPDNHKFYFHHANADNQGFVNRVNIYMDHAVPLDEETEIKGACQLLVVLPNDIQLFHRLVCQLYGFKLIRATSPIKDGYIWLEIFPKHVSKGSAIHWLMKHKGIDSGLSMSVGNDYNDIDMLEMTNYRYVVENAPVSMKMCYPVVKSNNASGFSDAVNRFFENKY